MVINSNTNTVVHTVRYRVLHVIIIKLKFLFCRPNTIEANATLVQVFEKLAREQGASK